MRLYTVYIERTESFEVDVRAGSLEEAKVKALTKLSEAADEGGEYSTSQHDEVVDVG